MTEQEQDAAVETQPETAGETEAPAEEKPAEKASGKKRDPQEVKQITEAILFASEKPVSAAKIADAVGETTATVVRKQIEALQSEYDEQSRAFQIEGISGGYQLLSRQEYVTYIRKIRKTRSDGKLSAAAMETLSIIAYKQPIKRVDVEAIRGVKSDALIRGLMEKGLVNILGRDKETPGNPLLYGTSREFLDLLGLQTLKDLPKPEELR